MLTVVNIYKIKYTRQSIYKVVVLYIQGFSSLVKEVKREQERAYKRAQKREYKRAYKNIREKVRENIREDIKEYIRENKHIRE